MEARNLAECDLVRAPRRQTLARTERVPAHAAMRRDVCHPKLFVLVLGRIYFGHLVLFTPG